MTLSIDMPDDELEQAIRALKAYHRFHDQLSEIVESGRLTEAALPDDYRWLVESLERLGNMPANAPR